MSARGSWLVLGAVFAALVFGLVTLFRLRLGQGDVFPIYSSIRADPLGLRALHDSLAELSGFSVERRTKPIAALEPLPPRLIVLAGLDADDWTHITTDEFKALDTAVRAGSRLVLAARADTYSEAGEAAKREAADRRKKLEPEDPDSRTPKVTFADLRLQWGITARERTLVDRATDLAHRTNEAPATLPAGVAWHSDLFFQPQAGSGWRVLYRRGAEAVLLERRLGLGSIVFAGDSFFLSNEALQRNRSTALLAWLVGPYTRVVFDESHLGVATDSGIAALARRYGLAGAAGTLLLLAVLFGWRRLALFVPPSSESAEVALTYHPAAGLEALLRRAVPADKLVAACATEWKRTAGAAEIARLERAPAPPPANAAAHYNTLVQGLRRRPAAPPGKNLP
jgi:hypothetical protein